MRYVFGFLCVMISPLVLVGYALPVLWRLQRKEGETP
jgi:hypothetical protein